MVKPRATIACCMRVTSGPDSPNFGSDADFALIDCAATGVTETDVATAAMLIDTAAATIALRIVPAFMFCSLDLLV
jgi:hypothetical protein